MSSTTQDLVDTLIHAATSERKCSFVELVPQEHVGTATAIICHAWRADFLELIMALVDDFNARWDAHNAYRNHHKTTAQQMAEEQAALQAQQEAAATQQQLEAMLSQAGQRTLWEPGEASHSMRKGRQRQHSQAHSLVPIPEGIHGSTGPNNTCLQPGCSAEQGTSALLAPAGPLEGFKASERRRARTSVTGIMPGQLPGANMRPPPAWPMPEQLQQQQQEQPEQPPSVMVQPQPRQRAVTAAVPTREPATQLPLDPVVRRKLAQQTTTLMKRVSPMRPITAPAIELQQHQAAPEAGPTDGEADAAPRPPATAQATLASFGQVVDVMRVTHASQQLSKDAQQPAKDIKHAVKRMLLAKRAMGLGPGMGRETLTGVMGPHMAAAMLDTAAADTTGPPRMAHMLARCGTLAKVRVAPGPGPADSTLSRLDAGDIYTRAAESTDLTKLLCPVDDEEVLVEAVGRAQKQVALKRAAAKVSKEQEALRAEKRKLLGYYVWIDVFALDQLRGPHARPAPPALVSMSRLINVVGRTVVVVDEEWSCLTRLWCLYEIWCTLKFKAALVTLSTPAALLAAQSRHTPLSSLMADTATAPPSPFIAGTPPTAGSLRTASLTSAPLGTRLSTRLSTRSSAPFPSGLHSAFPSSTAHLPTRVSSPIPLPSNPPGGPDSGLGNGLSSPSGLGSPQRSGSLEALDSFSGDEGGLASLPVPATISLLEARATRVEDQVAILGAIGEELASAHSKTNSLRQVSATMYWALLAAREHEATAPSLTRSVYAALAACSRNWSDMLAPNWKALAAARDALKAVCTQHLAKQFKEAKDVQAASNEDVEMEVWQLTRFLSTQLAAQRVEPFWVQELRRYSAMVNRSFATRFSQRYVDQLLRAAGTFDDMKVLRSYVHGQCHHSRLKSQRQDNGE